MSCATDWHANKYAFLWSDPSFVYAFYCKNCPYRFPKHYIFSNVSRTFYKPVQLKIEIYQRLSIAPVSVRLNVNIKLVAQGGGYVLRPLRIAFVVSGQ